MPTQLPPPGDSFTRLNVHFELLKVSARNVPDMTVEIAPGHFWYNSTKLVTYQGGTSPIINKPSSNAWLVVVSMNENGSIHLTYGQESSDPHFPDISPKLLPLAGVIVSNTTTAITDDMIYDLRPIFGASVFSVPHNYLSERDDVNSHPIDAISGLRQELDNRPKSIDVDNAIINKADVDGTPNNNFILNKDATGTPTQDCSFSVNRGALGQAYFKWSESQNCWVVSNQIRLDDSNGIILTSPGGNKYRLKVDDLGNLVVENV